MFFSLFSGYTAKFYADLYGSVLSRLMKSVELPMLALFLSSLISLIVNNGDSRYFYTWN